MRNRPAWVRVLLALALAGLLSAAAAVAGDAPASITTYRWVDAQGVVHYSDTPQPGAQKLQIQPAQTYQAPQQAAAASRGDEAPGAAPHRDCRIVQPGAEQSLFAPETVPVSVELDPPLRSDDQVLVTFDGQPLKPLDDSDLHFRIEAPDRGAHTLTLTVRDGAGSVVCSSSALTFYVERPSALSPLSPARGH